MVSLFILIYENVSGVFVNHAKTTTNRVDGFNSVGQYRLSDLNIGVFAFQYVYSVSRWCPLQCRQYNSLNVSVYLIHYVRKTANLKTYSTNLLKFETTLFLTVNERECLSIPSRSKTYFFFKHLRNNFLIKFNS